MSIDGRMVSRERDLESVDLKLCRRHLVETAREGRKGVWSTSRSQWRRDENHTISPDKQHRNTPFGGLQGEERERREREGGWGT